MEEHYSGSPAPMQNQISHNRNRAAFIRQTAVVGAHASRPGPGSRHDDRPPPPGEASCT